jgi:hypothetical protein
MTEPASSLHHSIPNQKSGARSFPQQRNRALAQPGGLITQKQDPSFGIEPESAKTTSQWHHPV